MTAVIGRTVIYEAETVEQAYASRRAIYDVPEWQLDAWVSTYTAIADGSLAGVTSAIPELTGRPASTLEDVLRRQA